MTTIAYRDGIIAADTLTTSSGGILSRASVKIGGRGGVLWCTSGDSAWGKAFRDWISTGMKGEVERPEEGSGATIFLPNGDIVVYHINGYELRLGLPFWAEGSGADFAIGAMQVGATAEQAVAAAMAWDHRTGGEIKVLKQ
jgi:ATP-dependent HslUV protease subunit HslV